MSRALSLTLIWAALVLSSAGCSSTDPAPFDTFAQGTRALRDGADLQARADIAASRDDFLDRAEDGSVDLLTLRLEFLGPTPFDSRLALVTKPDDEPLFLRLERFRGALWSLNQALVDYAELLQVLAGGPSEQSVQAADFDTLATELNAAVVGAAPALRVEASREGLALFSGAATALFRQAVESRRRRLLGEALREVQPQLVDVTGRLRTGVQQLAQGVQAQYQRDYRGLLTATDLDRRKRAAVLLELNDRTRATLRSLALLDDGYRELPAAHAALAQAASQRGTGTAAVADFALQATQLRLTVDRLRTEVVP